MNYEDPEILGAFNKVWFEGVDPKDLTDSEIEKTYNAYLDNPLKARTYKEWIKRSTYQHYVNTVNQ